MRKLIKWTKWIFYSFILLFVSYFNSESVAASTYLHSGDIITDTIREGEMLWYEINHEIDNGSIYAYVARTDAPVKITLLEKKDDRYSWLGSTTIEEKKKAGTYYIRVTPNWKKGEYSRASFDLMATYGTKQVKHTNETMEPNDVFESAFPIVNGKSYQATLTSENDVDFYKFEQLVDGEQVYLKQLTSSAPISFELFDENKQRITYYGKDYIGKLKKGTYYVKVLADRFGNEFTKADYEFECHFANGSVKHDPQNEPNDIPYNAYPLSNGEKLSSSLSRANDIDFYSVKITKDGHITVELTSHIPMNVRLYDSNLKELSYGLATNKINTRVKQGDYYIMVRPQNWGYQYSSGSYTLTASYPSQSKNIEITLTLESKTAIVNGKATTLLQAPYETKGYTLVPIRFVSEQLGANVKWNKNNKSINIALDGTELTLYENSARASVNGKSIFMDTKTVIRNGVTFVPLRFVSEQLGASVKWTQQAKKIDMTL